MEIQKVRIAYGYLDHSWTSYVHKVREINFPNCNDVVEGGCEIGFERNTDIYVCKECNIDRDRWMEENWQLWKEKNTLMWH